jgi:hypothetical protein
MGKLFNLKEWLTVADAARHLSIVFGEDVTEADVLRLGLDGRLRLSVYFVNHATAEQAKWVAWKEWAELVDLTRAMDEKLGLKIEKSSQDEERPVLRGDGRIVELSGIWDLSMTGGESLDVEHQWQMMTGGAPVELVEMDGVLVTDVNGQLYRLMDHFDGNPYASDAQKKECRNRPLYDKENYFPAGGLPKDAVIVVRTEALRELEQSVNGAPNGADKPLTTTERNTLLTIIAALCDYSAIKTDDRGAANQIAKLTEEIGATVSDDTVRRWLKQIPDALESRMK